MGHELSTRLKDIFPNVYLNEKVTGIRAMCFVDNKRCLGKEERDDDYSIGSENIIIRFFTPYANSCSVCPRNKTN